MTHPGDEWERLCTQAGGTVALVLGGQRSILTAWPPNAVCSRCLQPARQGYAGPASGDTVQYPNPAVVFVCEQCARAALNLTEKDLTGHTCLRECTDTRHVDVTFDGRRELEPLDDAAKIARFSDDYASRGWTVIAVVPAHDMVPAVSGAAWAIYFASTRSIFE
jgi:hypothetical protein